MGFFSPFLLYTLLAETRDKKAMGNKILKVTMNKKNKISNVSKFLIFAYTWNGTLEISESFGLIQFLVVSETQNPKTRKMNSNKKLWLSDEVY